MCCWILSTPLCVRLVASAPDLDFLLSDSAHASRRLEKQADPAPCVMSAGSNDTFPIEIISATASPALAPHDPGSPGKTEMLTSGSEGHSPASTASVGGQVPPLKQSRQSQSAARRDGSSGMCRLLTCR
jgi:hypothetical protein